MWERIKITSHASLPWPCNEITFVYVSLFYHRIHPLSIKNYKWNFSLSFVFMVERILKTFEQKLITTENEAIQRIFWWFLTMVLCTSKTNGHSDYVLYYIEIGSSSLSNEFHNWGMAKESRETHFVLYNNDKANAEKLLTIHYNFTFRSFTLDFERAFENFFFLSLVPVCKEKFEFKYFLIIS